MDDAIFNFELVLTQFATTSANIYLAMTTSGMAMAYLQRNDKERAIRLVNRSVKLIDNKKLIGSLHQWASINCEIASLYLNLGEIDKAIDMAKRGIELCRKHDSLFLLDELYLYLGKCYAKQGKNEEAKQALEIAKSLSIARHGSIMEEDILHELAKVQ